MASRASKSGAASASTEAPAKPVRSKSTKTAPEKLKPRLLPQYKVILHNDDKNDFDHVITTIISLCGLNKQDAELRTLEAHFSGCALLLVTHKERAELYVDQFQSCSLIVTIEPAE